MRDQAFHLAWGKHCWWGTGEVAVLWTRAQRSVTCPCPHMPCCGMDEGNYPHSLPTVAGGRDGLRIIRTEELALYLTNCSSWESGPYSSPRKNSKPALVVWTQERAGLGVLSEGELAPLLPACCSGWTSWDSAGELTSDGIEGKLESWPP